MKRTKASSTAPHVLDPQSLQDVRGGAATPTIDVTTTLSDVLNSMDEMARNAIRHIKAG
jgi:hypothetical protein